MIKGRNLKFAALAVFAILFLFLHFSVYLEIDPEFPLLTSATQSSIDSKRLKLCEMRFPDYFNLIQRATYVYCIDDDAQNLISETVPNYFGYARMPKSDGIRSYIGDEDFEGKLFARDMIGLGYPNILFFILQYLLIGGSIFVLRNLLKKN